MTTFPFDFDIFSSLPVFSDTRQIRPCEKRFVNGSSIPTYGTLEMDTTSRSAAVLTLGRGLVTTVAGGSIITGQASGDG